jgi:hypothetical protein
MSSKWILMYLRFGGKAKKLGGMLVDGLVKVFSPGKNCNYLGEETHKDIDGNTFTTKYYDCDEVYE